MKNKLLIILFLLILINISIASDQELLRPQLGDLELGIETNFGDNELGIGPVLVSQKSVGISLSDKLTAGINWTILSLPAFNLSAPDNNGTNITQYDIAISAIGTNADIYIKADGDLIENIGGVSVLSLGNETFSYNNTNSSVPSEIKFRLTIDYTDNKIGTNLPDGSYVYLKFFLNAPGNQQPGVYNNSILIKGVPAGQSP